jgi:hypothetical protein
MRIPFLFIVVVVLSLTGQAQKTSLGINLQLSFPQGEYKSTYPKTGVGLRFNVLYRLKEDGPLSIGGEVGYLVTGSDSRYFDIYYAGFYDRYRVSASNNVLSLAFKARADLLPNDRPVRLFIDGTVGTNLFYSSINIEQETYFGSSQSVGGDNSKGYWAFVWGPGLGMEFPVDKRKNIFIAAKGSYLFGANTTYLTDPYIDNNGRIYFTQHESKTDMILAELGLRITLFGRGSRGGRRYR